MRVPTVAGGDQEQLTKIARGMASTVTQYDDTDLEVGDLIDQVGYAYAKVASTGRNTIRRTGLTDDRWTKDLASDKVFVELDISYDRNSNIVGIEDQIVGAGTGFDVEYTMDNLDRLSVAAEGSMSAGSVGTTTRQEQWMLSQTANWELHQLDLDSTIDWSGTGALNDDRTHNIVNEITARDTDDNGSDDFTLTYDAVGNLADDGEDYEYVYDPFGRLREVRKTSNQDLVAEYRYNGLGFRVGWHYDVDADGTVENTSDDPWFFFAYDEGWRLVATYRSTDSSPKEQFVHHVAGMGGMGGYSRNSSIDRAVPRDRSATLDGDARHRTAARHAISAT